jgi:hypothetical protein
MTRLSDEQVKALIDGCEGVTPGPYVVIRDGDDASIRPVKDCGPNIWVHLARVENAFEDMDQFGALFDPEVPDEYSESQRALAYHFARCHPATIRSLATEVKESREAMHGLSVTTDTITDLANQVLESRKRIAEFDTQRDALRHEGYEEGMRDGQAEATGAQADFWTMALRYFKEHGAEPASDDGEGHNAYQMMDALFEHVRNIRAEKDARIAELEAEHGAAGRERDELKQAIFGEQAYDPHLSIQAFVRMAKDTEIARRSAVENAKRAEARIAELEAALAKAKENADVEFTAKLRYRDERMAAEAEVKRLREALDYYAARAALRREG